MTDVPGASKNGIWSRILAIAIPLLVAGLIGWGTLRQQVHDARDDVQALDRQKASRDVVEAQYQAILRELQSIRAELGELRRRP